MMIEAGELRVKTEGQRGRRRRTNRVGHDAKSFGVIFDVIEQNDFGIGRPRRHFGDRADLQIPIRAVDFAQFAEFIDRVEIATQIFVG